MSSAFSPAQHHAERGDAFFDPVDPARFPAKILCHHDQDWAARASLETQMDAEWIAHFARFEPLPRSLPQPMAPRYHGYQSRSYNPDLGDGRLSRKGDVREVLATELLEALGVYTTKGFSLVETGEQLHRSDEPSPTRSVLLVRLNHSHIRIGSFQRFAYLEQTENISRLLDYTVSTCMAECPPEEEPARAVAFLAAVS